MKPEDFEPIDETSVDVHEGHPVDVLVSVRLTASEARMLHEVADREGTDVIETMRAALHEYAARRSARATR